MLYCFPKRKVASQSAAAVGISVCVLRNNERIAGLSRETREKQHVTAAHPNMCFFQSPNSRTMPCEALKLEKNTWHPMQNTNNIYDNIFIKKCAVSVKGFLTV